MSASSGSTGSGRARVWSSGVAGVLACVLLPLALLAGWTKAVVTDTDRYVATVGPLADNADVQRAVTAQATKAIENAVDLAATQQQLQQSLTDRGNPRLAGLVPVLGGMLQQLAGDAVQTAVATFVASPEFSTAWKDANRSAHEQLVAILSGDKNAIADSRGRVSIQLATVVNAIVAKLAAEGYPVGQIPTFDASVPVIDTSNVEKAQRAYSILDALGWWVPVLMIVLTVATVLLARDRRRSVWLLAIGWVVAIIVLAAGLRVAHHLVFQSLPADADQAASDAVWSIVIAGLRHAMQVCLVVAVVALVVSWVLGPGTAPAWIRERAGSVAASVSSRPHGGEADAAVDSGATRRVVVGVAVVVAAIVALVWLV